MEKSLREHSRTLYTHREPTNDNINTGSLQRIADAVEKMAGNYLQMQNDNDWLRKRKQQLEEKVAHLEKSNAALRGVINRMKKKQNPSTL